MIFGVPSRTARTAFRFIAVFFLATGYSDMSGTFIGVRFTVVFSETFPKAFGAILWFMSPIQIRWAVCGIIRIGRPFYIYVVELARLQWTQTQQVATFMVNWLWGTRWESLACSCTIPVNHPEFNRGFLCSLSPCERVGSEVGSLERVEAAEDIAL